MSISRLLLVLLLISYYPNRLRAQEVTVSYQTFYDELSPYGQWVNDGEYGNVWVPNEGPGYRPYGTGGHWAMTEYGNTWVSDAPYGWACYHYGRWTYNPYYGWVWIPGYEWAPAWVSWRSGGGYYGWAPMGPGYYPGGVYEYPDNYWVFVGPEYLYQPNVYTYYTPRHAGWYTSRTTFITETYVDRGSRATYYYGPRREEIEGRTHQPVQVYHVSGADNYRSAGVHGSELSVYRPGVNRESMRTARPANVMQATRPVGRPQDISRREERRQPEFRQQMQQQNPGFRNTNSWSGRSQPAAEPGRRGSMNENNRPGPQRFDGNENPGGRQQRPAYNPRYNQSEINNRNQYSAQPGTRQAPQPGNSAPQRQQMHEMNRPQMQQNQQQSRPAPQRQEREQPAQNERRR